MPWCCWVIFLDFKASKRENALVEPLAWLREGRPKKRKSGGRDDLWQQPRGLCEPAEMAV